MNWLRTFKLEMVVSICRSYFIILTYSLSEALEDAKTNEGQQLRNEFDAWVSDFRQQESIVRRHAILTGVPR